MRIVKRQATYWDLAGDGRPCRVHVLDKQEQWFEEGEVPSFEIFDDHPLLVPYRHSWRSVYISAALQQPETFFHDALAVLNAELAPWRSAEIYFNRQAGAVSVLRSGYGLLFEGPSPLAETLFSRLAECHATPKSFAARSRGTLASLRRWPELRDRPGLPGNESLIVRSPAQPPHFTATPPRTPAGLALRPITL